MTQPCDFCIIIDLNGHASGEAAKCFADSYIGNGKLAKLINQAVLKLETNARKEKLRNQLLEEKQMLLETEKVAAERETKLIEADKKEEAAEQAVTKQAAELAQQLIAEQEPAKKLAQERQQKLTQSSYLTSPLRRVFYFASDTTSSVVSAAVKTPGAIASAVTTTVSTVKSTVQFVSESREAIAKGSGALAGFIGTLGLKNHLHDKFGFDISDTQDFNKINQRRSEALLKASKAAHAKAFIKDTTHFTIRMLGYTQNVAQAVIHYDLMLFDKNYREYHNRTSKYLQELKDVRCDESNAEHEKYNKNCLTNQPVYGLTWKDRDILPSSVCTMRPESQETYNQRIKKELTAELKESIGELRELKLEDDCFSETYSDAERTQLKTVLSTADKTKECKDQPKTLNISDKTFGFYAEALQRREVSETYRKVQIEKKLALR